MADTQGFALDWDDEVADEGGFTLLPDGDYDFEVTEMKRGNYPGSPKIAPCKKVDLTLKISGAEGTTNVLHGLILWSTLQWKIAQFFKCIGSPEVEGRVRMNWQMVPGSKGRAKITHRSYTDKNEKEHTVNDVDTFYAPDSSVAPTTPATTPAPTYEKGRF